MNDLKVNNLKMNELKECINLLVMYEAHKRFDKVVKILMINNPGLYIR